MSGNDMDTATAAALIKVSPRRLQQLAAGGWIKPSGRNRWPLVGTVQGYFSFLKGGPDDDAAGLSKTAVQEARAEEIRHRIAREDRETIDMAETTEALAVVTAEFIHSFESLPARITKNPRERARIAALCAAEIGRMKEQFAQINKELLSDES